jgi:CheY-like chemotaxis protein
MRTIWIVDDEIAKSLAAEFTRIAESERQEIVVEGLQTPAELFSRLNQEVTPDLILLDHTWDGLTITQLLERVLQLCPLTRVVVFTGQEYSMTELIASIRLGIVDYWKKSSMTRIQMWNKAIFYMDDPMATLQKLSRPVGSVEALLRRADELARELDTSRQEHDECQAELSHIRQQMTSRIFSSLMTALNTTIIVIVLSASFIAITRFGAVTGWHAIGVIVIEGVVALFANDKLKTLKARRGDASVEANR